MVTLHPSEEAFFFVQDAAEAAAEATVNRLPQGKGTVAALCIGTAVAGVAYVVTRPRVKKAVKELLGLTKDWSVKAGGQVQTLSQLLSAIQQTSLHTTTTFAMTEAAVYHKLQDLRLLARRDSTLCYPQVDQELELFRLSFIQAFEDWMDGMKELDLTPFIVTADRIITSNKDLLSWLKKQLELEASRG
jgi:hypothetical protein